MHCTLRYEHAFFDWFLYSVLSDNDIPELEGTNVDENFGNEILIPLKRTKIGTNEMNKSPFRPINRIPFSLSLQSSDAARLERREAIFETGELKAESVAEFKSNRDHKR